MVGTGFVAFIYLVPAQLLGLGFVALLMPASRKGALEQRRKVCYLQFFVAIAMATWYVYFTIVAELWRLSLNLFFLHGASIFFIALSFGVSVAGLDRTYRENN